MELGLQTAFDETAERINRCHSFGEFLGGYLALKKRGIRVSVHIIDGLPGESPEMMTETARILGKLRPEGVKIQLLHGGHNQLCKIRGEEDNEAALGGADRSRQREIVDCDIQDGADRDKIKTGIAAETERPVDEKRDDMVEYEVRARRQQYKKKAKLVLFQQFDAAFEFVEIGTDTFMRNAASARSDTVSA